MIAERRETNEVSQQPPRFLVCLAACNNILWSRKEILMRTVSTNKSSKFKEAEVAATGRTPSGKEGYMQEKRFKYLFQFSLDTKKNKSRQRLTPKNHELHHFLSSLGRKTAECQLSRV